MYSLLAGAFGCTISGAGPTCVAVVSDPQVGTAVAAAMEEAFTAAGLKINSTLVTGLDQTGICVVPPAAAAAAISAAQTSGMPDLLSSSVIA